MLDRRQAQSLPKALPREVRSLAILTTTGAGGRSGGCERRPASLLKNSAATGKHWLRLHLVGKKSHRLRDRSANELASGSSETQLAEDQSGQLSFVAQSS